jgi:hypothetical protein
LSTGGSVRCTSIRIASAPSRAIRSTTRAAPHAMTRVTPEQLAMRTMRERLTLLRNGAQATTSSRGRASSLGGL